MTLLAVWELAARSGILRSHLLPAPSVVLASLIDPQQQGVLLSHVTATCLRVLDGFALGALSGTLLGILTGRSARASALLDPMLQALRSIPSLAWVPLFLLWLGIQETSKVALIAVGVFFPVYLNLMSGIRAIDPGLLEVAEMFQYPRVTQPTAAARAQAYTRPSNMYLGHMAAGLALKARVREAPLAWLLAATVLSDLLCGVLLVLGAERTVIHGSLMFSHAQSDIRYSHSLLGTLLLALPVGALAARVFQSRRIGVAVAVGVVSHYVLDVLSHLSDMPVIGFGAEPDLVLGTHLAAYPLVHFVVELAWCLLAWALLDRGDRRLLWTMLFLMVLYSNSLLGYIALPPASSVVMGASMLVLFIVTPALLLWAARTR